MFLANQPKGLKSQVITVTPFTVRSHADRGYRLSTSKRIAVPQVPPHGCLAVPSPVKTCQQYYTINARKKKQLSIIISTKSTAGYHLHLIVQQEVMLLGKRPKQPRLASISPVIGSRARPGGPVGSGDHEGSWMVLGFSAALRMSWSFCMNASVDRWAAKACRVLSFNRRWPWISVFCRCSAQARI